jgi:hypothetical protein
VKNTDPDIEAEAERKRKQKMKEIDNTFFKKKKLNVQAVALHLAKETQITNFSELVCYTLFFFLTLSWSWQYDLNWLNYSQRTSLTNGFLGQPFVGEPYPKTFSDVASIDDLWDFLEKAFVPVMFNQGNPHSLLLDYYALVGAIRLRQVRVAPVECELRADSALSERRERKRHRSASPSRTACNVHGTAGHTPCAMQQAPLASLSRLVPPCHRRRTLLCALA